MISNFPCDKYFRELRTWEGDSYVESNIEVVSLEGTTAPGAAAASRGEEHAGHAVLGALPCALTMTT
jgi:hypothetical protein